MKKEKNDLNELREIKIVSTGYTRPGSHNAEDEVNRLIGEGWQILETYITCYSNFPPSDLPTGSPFCPRKKGSRSKVNRSFMPFRRRLKFFKPRSKTFHTHEEGVGPSQVIDPMIHPIPLPLTDRFFKSSNLNKEKQGP